MKIALIGFGQMGKMIERLALDQGHAITARLSSQSVWDTEAIREADVCIEFTHPRAVLDNIQKLAKLKKNLVIGSTGWYEQLDYVRALTEANEIGAVYTPNFSIGVHLLFEIVNYASSYVNALPDYEAMGIEYHHGQKKDKPSGTALEIAKIVEKNIDRLTYFPFSSVRGGAIPGTHTVLFDSLCDTIEITHTARNREGFAKGALQAAEWIKGKKGLYSFKECLKDLLPKKVI